MPNLGESCHVRAVPRPPVGLVRRLLPTLVVAVGIVALIMVWGAPGFADSDRVRLPLIAGVLVVFTLVLIRLLRPLGASRKVVTLGLLWLVGVAMLVWRLSSMDGNFRPILVARHWVQDLFLGGSPDSVLERHRQEQGTAGGPADLTIKPGDWPAFRGVNRDGVATGPTLAREWSKTPPKEIWRQPVGGGYASFAIANGFLVTIEQRRDREVVVCYEASVGQGSLGHRLGHAVRGDGRRARARERRRPSPTGTSSPSGPRAGSSA